MAAETLSAPLRQAVAGLARTPRLLVVCDYDGTLAPIVEDPAKAVPRPEAMRALRSLAELPDTSVGLISGRALRDLAALSGLSGASGSNGPSGSSGSSGSSRSSGASSGVHLVGSHGAEFDAGFADALDDQAQALRRKLEAGLEELVGHAPGVFLETKPASVAVHVRRAEPAVGESVLEAVRSGPARWAGIHVTEGKAVIELAVLETDKGAALDMLRRQADATAALFVGDDVTDEKAFARLAGPDVGVKVGPGRSLAEYSVPDTADVAVMLADLLAQRQARPGHETV
ncbi:trehalose-phosphatase [Catenulispora sp. MAP12-49]